MPSTYEIEARLKGLRAQLFNIKDVVGVGIGEAEGKPCLVIMLRKDSEHTRAMIASIVKDIPCKIQVTGEFRPLEVTDPP
ncbi:MAG: hypothetical protein QXU44_09615 [Candidatus Caldarchaeum sp.]